MNMILSSIHLITALLLLLVNIYVSYVVCAYIDREGR